MFRRFLSLISLLIIYQATFSQALAPCATVTTDEIRAKMLSISREARIGINTRDTEYFLPIQFHVVGNDLGNGYF
ncbi:MAG: hypothetical protein H0X62_05105, partial [Bacteroidetes bacterium]|nr:hypothetical protein [Bacteroidota bacterium]